MLSRILPLLILLCGSRCVMAGPFVQVTQQICHGNSCTIVSGSGTVIGRDQKWRLIVLTCAHGWDWPDRKVVSPHLVLLDGVRHEAGVVGWGKRAADIGLLCLDPAVQTASAVRLADAMPPIGKSIETHAVLNGQEITHRGIFSGMLKCGGIPVMQLTTPFAQGESGGAVLADGRLVGVINATGVNHPIGIAARLDDVRQCLATLHVDLAYPADQTQPGATVIDPPKVDEPRESPPAAEPVPKLPAVPTPVEPRPQEPVAPVKEVPPAAVVPQPPKAPEPPARSAAWSVVETGVPMLLGALGVGGPIGAGVWLGLRALGAAGREVRKRRAAKATEPAAANSVPVIVSNDSRPPAQAIIPETHFVSVERDTYAEAYGYAKSQLVRKFPGCEGTIGTLDSLIDQYLSAKGLLPKKV